jgi:hypothetical protein
MRARSAADGLAVPTSSPRYTWSESATTTSMARRAARAATTADLPTAVGPTSTSTGAGSGSADGRTPAGDTRGDQRVRRETAFT